MKILVGILAWVIRLVFGAKLKAPLLSLGAAGQIGKSIVFFAWKGIDAVREYVVPANPRSTAQITQRTHLTNAVEEFHDEAYTDADMVAWGRYAGTLAKIMSGFNAMIKLCVEAYLVPDPWTLMSDIQVDTPTVNGFDVDVENSLAGQNFRAVIGTRRTHFPTAVALVDDGDGTYSLTWAGGTTKTDYFVKLESREGGFWRQRSGIYHVKTA